MVALCLEEGDGDNFHEDDIQEAEELVDAMDDHVLIGDMLGKRPSPDQTTENVIIVDNIPVADSSKMAKLKSVLQKIFGKCGKVEDLCIPMNENQKTKGYMFVVYRNAQEATTAISSCNGYKLDKNHCFAVNRLSDFETFMDIPE